MSAAANAAGYLYISGRMRRGHDEQRVERHGAEMNGDWQRAAEIQREARDRTVLVTVKRKRRVA